MEISKIEHLHGELSKIKERRGKIEKILSGQVEWVDDEDIDAQWEKDLEYLQLDHRLLEYDNDKIMEEIDKIESMLNKGFSWSFEDYPSVYSYYRRKTKPQLAAPAGIGVDGGFFLGEVEFLDLLSVFVYYLTDEANGSIILTDMTILFSSPFGFRPGGIFI